MTQTMEAVAEPADPPLAAHAGIAPSRGASVAMIVLGLVGWTTSFLLFLEYVSQLTKTAPIINCALSAVVSCVPNLLSPAGNLLGFSNSIIGVTAFTAPVFIGISALFGAQQGVWFWRLFAVGVLAAMVLVHRFAWLSVFVFGEICPWCVCVWLATIPLFWLTLAWTLRAGVWGSAPTRVGSVLLRWVVPITLLDYGVIAVAAQLRLSVVQSLIGG